MCGRPRRYDTLREGSPLSGARTARGGIASEMALKRELGALGVFAVATGAMISSGLFVLPALVFAEVGPGVFLCYLMASLLLLPALLSKAELMTAMPKAGGTYFFIDRSFGPGLGTVGGIAAWASLAFKSAFALLGVGALASFVWPMSLWQIKAVACGFCVLFAVVNLVGVKHVGRAQVALVAILLGVLIVYSAGASASWIWRAIVRSCRTA